MRKLFSAIAGVFDPAKQLTQTVEKVKSAANKAKLMHPSAAHEQWLASAWIDWYFARHGLGLLPMEIYVAESQKRALPFARLPWPESATALGTMLFALEHRSRAMSIPMVAKEIAAFQTFCEMHSVEVWDEFRASSSGPSDVQIHINRGPGKQR